MQCKCLLMKGLAGRGCHRQGAASAKIAPVAAIALVSWLAGIVVTPALTAQNLLVNPRFNRDLSGWQTAGAAIWSSPDADGLASSGSVEGFTDSPTVTGLYTAVTQCVPVALGASYQVGGKVLIPSGQAVEGSAFFAAVLYTDSHCQSSPPPGQVLTTTPVTTVGSWTSSISTFKIPYGASAMFYASYQPASGGHFQANFDDVVFTPVPTGCVADAHTLCLQGLRFKVTATSDVGDGVVQAANVAPLGDSGYMWFFDAGNVEALVKVVDGCYLGDHYWFFAAGLTNVEMVITVTDTTNGTVKTYNNPANTAFQPIQDTAAFTCS